MGQVIRRNFLLLVLVFLTLAGCRSTDTRPRVDRDHLIPSRHFRFADGDSAIFYTLDKSLSTSSPQHFDTLMFVIGGSGCDSMQYFLPHYFRGLEGESGPIRILCCRNAVLKIWDGGETGDAAGRRLWPIIRHDGSPTKANSFAHKSCKMPR